MHHYNEYFYQIYPGEGGSLARGYVGVIPNDPVVAVDVYYNQDAAAFLRGYHIGDPMEKVLSMYLPATEENIFEEMFQFLNEDLRPPVGRSLSVGDVIEVHPRLGRIIRATCDNTGWLMIGDSAFERSAQ